MHLEYMLEEATNVCQVQLQQEDEDPEDQEDQEGQEGQGP